MIAKRFFSNQKYDLCLLICESLFDILFQPSITIDTLYQLISLRSFITLSAVLSNDLLTGMYSTLKTIKLYEYYESLPSQTHHFESTVNGIMSLYRLRLLLIVPSLPTSQPFPLYSQYSLQFSSSNQLIRYRVQMEEDLRIFIQYISSQNITIHLNVISLLSLLL